MRDSESGLALVIVLIIVVILSIVIAQFNYSVSVDERIAKNYAMDRKNYYAARGGIVLATALLEKDAQEDGPRDTLSDDWADSGALQIVPIGDIETTITVTDQERLININRLSNKKNKDYARIRQTLARLIEILELDTDEIGLLERITDYLDPDEEGDYEEGAKNGPLTTIEEMLQIPGLTPRFLYGYTTEEGEKVNGLAYFIGLWGSARININTASPEVLRAISPEISEEDAGNIVEYRSEEPFNTPADIINVTGMSDIYHRDRKLMQYLTTLSTYFEVRIRANKDNVKKDVRAILQRKGKKVIVLFWKERGL